ncbi:unnamed protein product, partial [Vitis vinifera]
MLPLLELVMEMLNQTNPKKEITITRETGPFFCLSCLIRLSSLCLIRMECILSPYRTKGFDRIFLSLPEFNQ